MKARSMLGAVTDLRIAVCTAAKASGVVQIKIGARTVSAYCPQDLTVAAKDPVLVGRIGTAYWILQRYFTAVGNIDAMSDNTSSEPVSSPCTMTGTTTFVPKQTATYRGSRWVTGDDGIYQGEYGTQGNNTGCAFYGTAITNALIGVTVISAVLKAHRVKGGAHGAVPTTLQHVAQFSKPVGAPTLGGSYTGPDLEVGHTNAKVPLDTALAQSLVDGTYGGLAIHNAGSPYAHLAGLSTYAAAFAVTIHWRRTT